MMEQYTLLSARFTVIESDGDESLPLSGASFSFAFAMRDASCFDGMVWS
jgi:hypothetical protein